MKTFTYTPYTDENKGVYAISKMSGFISPEGKFFNCYEYMGDNRHELTGRAHNLFAEKYCEEILGVDLHQEYRKAVEPIIDELTNEEAFEMYGNDCESWEKSLSRKIPEISDSKDKLVHIFGFIYYVPVKYVSFPLILYPYPYYNGKTITEKQKELLLQIWECNSYDYSDLEDKIDVNKVKTLMPKSRYNKFFESK